MGESTRREAVVVLEAAQVPAARTLAADHGVEAQQVPRLGIEPVTTVTLVLVGAAAAVGGVLHILEQRKGGQVVDLRPGAPKAFYRTPDVVYGTVIIVTVDGKVAVEVREPEGMFGKVISTLPELISGGDDSVEQVAQSVTEEFGSSVEIETSQISGPEDPE